MSNTTKKTTTTIEEIEAKKVTLEAVGYPFNFNYMESAQLEISNKKLFEEYAKEQWLGIEAKKRVFYLIKKSYLTMGLKF